MKMPIILAFVLLLSQYSLGQEVHAQNPTWHRAGKRLTEPSLRNKYHTALNYFSHYDTLPCMYVGAFNGGLQKGFKVVLIKDGYCTDNSRTFGVFLDDRSQRIYHVRKYYFML
jgi:hypothetical protein